MRQQLLMQGKRLETQYTRFLRLEDRNYLAHTGSSPLDATSSRRPRTARPSPRSALHQQNPPPFSHSICGKARPKTSVAVSAARGDAHTPAQPRTLSIATVRRQRASTVAAGTTNSPTKGAAA